MLEKLMRRIPDAADEALLQDKHVTSVTVDEEGGLTPAFLAELEKHVSHALNAPVVRYGGGDEKKVTRFALCSGAAGEEEALEALRRGAQVLLTGEMKHNELLAACARGLTVLCAGHRATEICAAQSMAGHLQIALNRLQLNVRLFVSRIDPFV